MAVVEALLVVPAGLDFSRYDFAAAGEPHRWGDYAIGEQIDHVDGVTIEDAEHMLATRAWQNTSKVHFDVGQRPDGRRLIYGGHVISLARALSFNGLANAQMIVALNAGAHAALRGSPSVTAGGTASLHLHRRALDGPVRAEHATVACPWAQHDLAAFAFVEELAGIRGHRLPRGEAAVRTRQHGLEHDAQAHRQPRRLPEAGLFQGDAPAGQDPRQRVLERGGRFGALGLPVRVAGHDHAERGRDRRGDEAIGSGDDQQFVAAPPVKESLPAASKMMPPITTVASGRCTSAPAPVAIAIGRKPMLATNAVEITTKALGNANYASAGPGSVYYDNLQPSGRVVEDPESLEQDLAATMTRLHLAAIEEEIAAARAAKCNAIIAEVRIGPMRVAEVNRPMSPMA